jgi:hypothetical protein
MQHNGLRFFVGLVALCLGASLVLDLVFDVHLPILRALIAALLLVYGARLVVRGLASRDRAAANEVWLDEQMFAPEGAPTHDEHYEIAFGRGLVDLTHLAEPATDVTVSVHALFGAAVVTIDPSIPYDVEGSAALGEVRLPDHNATATGHVAYRPRFDHPPRLHLRVHAVLGQCQVVETTS